MKVQTQSHNAMDWKVVFLNQVGVSAMSVSRENWMSILKNYQVGKYILKYLELYVAYINT